MKASTWVILLLIISMIVVPNIGTSYAQSTKFKELYAKGISFAKNGQYKEAITSFKKALDIEPKNAVVLYNIGYSLQKLGKYEEAVTYYQKALKIDPNYIFALNSMGSALISLGKYKEAITYLDRVLKIEPKNEFALKWKKIANNKLNSIPENQGTTTQSTKFKELYAKGISFAKNGQYKEAITSFKKALDIEPKNAVVLYNIGYSLYKLGKDEEAITYYQKALKIDPNYILALNSMGSALISLGKYKEAITYFDRVLKIEPNNEIALKWKKEASAKLNSIPENQGTTTQSTKFKELFEKGKSLYDLGKYEEAITYFKSALDIEPKNAYALLLMGISLQKMDRSEEAITIFERYLDIEPKNAAVVAFIGYSLDKLGRYEEAITYYQKSLKIDPNYIFALNSMSSALISLGKYKEAITYSDMVLKIEPNNESAKFYKKMANDKLNAMPNIVTPESPETPAGGLAGTWSGKWIAKLSDDCVWSFPLTMILGQDANYVTGTYEVGSGTKMSSGCPELTELYLANGGKGVIHFTTFASGYDGMIDGTHAVSGSFTSLQLDGRGEGFTFNVYK